MTSTEYRCSKCDSTDSDSGRGGPAPIALICFRCQAGRGLSPEQQAAKGVGMLPTIRGT